MSGLQNGGSPRSNRNEIENLKRKNEYLESQLEQLTHKTARLSDDSGQYYVATASNIHGTDKDKVKNALRPMPKIGSAARHVATYIRDHNVLDFNPRLNTSSYVNVIFEPEELEVANMGLSVNLADQTVYPQSYELHNMCINMVAQLWNCPETDEIRAEKVFPGAGLIKLDKT
jgi:glutamate/tyrosine decarboxylase-like PLP-dependent enzyme